MYCALLQFPFPCVLASALAPLSWTLFESCESEVVEGVGSWTTLFPDESSGFGGTVVCSAMLFDVETWVSTPPSPSGV